MYTSLRLLAFASAVSALVARNDKCYFGLTAQREGIIGQLSDGQNRVGGNLQPASYTLSNGIITDASGRGCILTPPTTQFQCDQGASGTPGFSINCDGTVSYNGNEGKFYECETGDGAYNIYTQPPAGQSKCKEFTLTATACAPPCPSAPPPSPPAPSPPPPPPKTCPASLTGEYQFPHLIVPVDNTRPDQALGTSYNGVIVATEDSLFLFDIPGGYRGKTCSLVFLLPEKKQLQTSSYDLSGSGAIDFAQLAHPVTQGTTWNSKGPIVKDLGVITLAPGGSAVVATFACPAGAQLSYQLSSVGGTNLTYFQDFNPPAIGLYITTC